MRRYARDYGRRGYDRGREYGGPGYAAGSRRGPDHSRYGDELRARPAREVAYGFGFRRGYEVQGGFGPANEDARGRRRPAWPGALRPGRNRG